MPGLRRGGRGQTGLGGGDSLRGPRAPTATSMSPDTDHRAPRRVLQSHKVGRGRKGKHAKTFALKIIAWS